MKKLSFIFATILFFAGATVINAQDNNDTHRAKHHVAITIPTLAILDIEGDGGEASTIDLTLDVSAAEAGAEVVFASSTNNELNLNYTSLVESGKKNKITAKINKTAAQITRYGFHLNLSIGANNGGAGGLGTPNSGVIEFTDNTEKDIVTGIKSCYSGDGNNNGNMLTYSLAADDYSKIRSGSNYNLEVTYTIIADN